MNKNLILSLLLFVPYSLSSQNVFTDSLTNSLEQPKISSLEKMNTYNKIVEKFRTEMMYEKASAFNKKYIELARKEKNLTELTKAYVNEGMILDNQEHYEKAALYLDSVRVSSLQTKDKKAAAYAKYLQVYLSKSANEQEATMSHSLDCLSLLEQTDGDFRLQFKLYYKLYGIYTEWNDLANTLKYAQKTVEAALKSGNKNDLSNAYSALAVAYTYQYEASKTNNDFQSILEYCEKATALYEQFPGQVSGYTYAIARNNKASYLLSYSPKITKEIRKEAEYNIKESLAISSKLPHAQSTQAGSLGMLSNLAKDDGNLGLAEQYLLQAYEILQAQKPVYYNIMIRVVSELSDIYEEKGNLKKALQFQKELNDYKALLFNQSEAAAVKSLEAQYQFDKKEQEMQLLEERAKNQQKQKLLYAGLSIISLIGAFFMFRSYNYRLKYSLEREQKLTTEKHETELELELEKEEQSRLKAEQELLALQQQKLYDEVMVNQLHIQHKNNVLKQLKEDIDNNKPLKLNQIIREENVLDNDFEKTKFQIQKVHPNFFKSLNENAKQKLTSLDMKYCAYFYLGMETKQIAHLLKVEPKSVRMTKYRLKQKLGLDAETDLMQHLKDIES